MKLAHSFPVLFLALLANLGCGQENRRIDVMRDDSRPRIPIYSSITGEGDTTLLFIHGWNINSTYWQHAADQLEGNYKIVLVDLPYHGRSQKAKNGYEPETMAESVSQVILEKKLSNIILIGHSLGGELAILTYFQNRASVIGIIGVDNFKDLDFRITPELKKGLDAYVVNFGLEYESMAETFVRQHIRSADSAVVKRIVADYVNADPQNALNVFTHMLPAYEKDRDLVGRLPFALKIIASDYMPVNEEALKKYCKSGYRIEYITDAGHFPMVEQPEQFIAALRRMLKPSD